LTSTSTGTEIRLDAFDHARPLRLAGHIERVEARRLAKLSSQRRAFIVQHVGNGDFRAGLDEHPARRRAHAARAAGDDGNLAVHSGHVSLLAQPFAPVM
jgi:hypothetical protein